MNRCIQSFALTAVPAFLLTACSGSSAKAPAASAPSPTVDATSQAANVGTSAGPSTGGSTSSSSAANPANVDVCALLTQADANAVARAHGLDGAQTTTTTYTLTAKKQIDTGIEPTSSCKFTIADDGAEGTVAFQVGSAAHFSVYSTGTKVNGLGDEAYDDGSSTVVRVGSLMISAGEDSFGGSFATDLLRKMVPNLK